MFNYMRKIKYRSILNKETNDSLFIKKVNQLIQKISNCNGEISDQKIIDHFDKIKSLFLNKTCNDITYLETKKMAYNYHLYLLEQYYNKVYSALFLEESSN